LAAADALSQPWSIRSVTLPCTSSLQTRRGMRIRYVIDTHLHADHVSAGRALAEAAGAEYVLFAEAAANFPFRGVRDGEVLELGNDHGCCTRRGTLPSTSRSLSPIERAPTSPGLRSPVIRSWWVISAERSSRRGAEEGARALFSSVQRFKALPEHLEILPGAYSGSVCGRSLSGKPTSTIGFEKRYNKAFRIGDEREFVRAMLADIPPPPPQAAEIRAVNSGRMAAAE
jgi:hydroxyacylglutathione hydrolase